jgi:hypothetical protein
MTLRLSPGRWIWAEIALLSETAPNVFPTCYTMSWSDQYALTFEPHTMVLAPDDDH